MRASIVEPQSRTVVEDPYLISLFRVVVVAVLMWQGVPRMKGFVEDGMGWHVYTATGLEAKRVP
jgi:hypothetical protein